MGKPKEKTRDSDEKWWNNGMQSKNCIIHIYDIMYKLPIIFMYERPYIDTSVK